VVNTAGIDAQSPNTVLVVEYKGKAPAYDTTAPVTVSAQFPVNTIEAVHAKTTDSARVKSLTYSHYFGDWKHAVCVTNMMGPKDEARFDIRITDAADYKVILEYACNAESARQEGSVLVNGKEYLFRTLRSSEFDKSAPLMFIQHAVAITTIAQPGLYTIAVRPLQQGKELFKLKSVRLEPIK
jgi:alpha-L-fucosidase